jgi:hypothetical protein
MQCASSVPFMHAVRQSFPFCVPSVVPGSAPVKHAVCSVASLHVRTVFTLKVRVIDLRMCFTVLHWFVALCLQAAADGLPSHILP